MTKPPTSLFSASHSLLARALSLYCSPAAQKPAPPLSRWLSPQVRLPLVTVSAKRYFHATAGELNDDPYIEGMKLDGAEFLPYLLLSWCTSLSSEIVSTPC